MAMRNKGNIEASLKILVLILPWTINLAHIKNAKNPRFKVPFDRVAPDKPNKILAVRYLLSLQKKIPLNVKALKRDSE